MTRSRWTILVYIAAHNDLGACGLQSLQQLRTAGASSDVRICALFDGYQGATRYVMATPEEPEFSEGLGPYDAGDPVLLVETARWAFERNPAERYALVLWSHGTGYWNQSDFQRVIKRMQGVAASTTRSDEVAAERCMALFTPTIEAIMHTVGPEERATLFDNGTQHSLDTLQLGQAMDQIKLSIGQPLDLLGMDACLMGNIEVAYQLRQKVRYLVASEELVPGSSWPYDAIVEQLKAQPEVDGAEFARRIVANYAAYYAAHPPAAGDVTKIALDLAQLDTWTAPIRTLAELLAVNMGSHMPLLWSAQRSAYAEETRADTRCPNKFVYHLWDLTALAAHLAEHSPNVDVRSAAAAVAALRQHPAVLAEVHHGAWFDKIGGYSVYMAPTLDPRMPLASTYAKLAFAVETRWWGMLRAYKAAM